MRRDRDFAGDAAWTARQESLAALYCASSHDFRGRRRRSMHLGTWRSCRKCLLIEVIPDLTVLR